VSILTAAAARNAANSGQLAPTTMPRSRGKLRTLVAKHAVSVQPPPANATMARPTTYRMTVSYHCPPGPSGTGAWVRPVKICR